MEAIQVLNDRNLGRWWAHASMTEKGIVYLAFMLTVSVIVQVVATVLIGHG